jgi:type VI secretion system protein ImpC
MAETTQTQTVDGFLSAVLKSVMPADSPPQKAEELLKGLWAPATPTSAPATPEEAKKARETEKAAHFMKLLATLLTNIDYAQRGKSPDGQEEYFIDKKTFADILERLNQIIALQLNEVFHRPELRDMEGKWRAIADLVARTNFDANIGISLLDATKDELGEDLSLNAADIAGSEVHRKVYVSEYDQLGGEPYGAIIGLYEFENTYKDRTFLRAMATVCKNSHAPFVASVSPSLFGLESMSQLMEVRDVSAKLDEAWQALRSQEEFAYIGLTLPRYIVRRPYQAQDSAGGVVRFAEQPPSPEAETQRYVWANSAMLFARNLVRSFESSGWCQYIRGVKGGGLIESLPYLPLEVQSDELRPPLEVVIPDYAELALAESGFIPLVHKKGTTDAVFFSCQSIKRPSIGTDPRVSENSQLTTNLSYTFSISRIAHYLKRMMRDNVGSNADAAYVRAQVDTWIARYVTTIVNPDDLTLRYYPFRAYALDVKEVPGRIGWYDCTLTIQPHIQFEGMDVTLRVDARLS